MEDIHKPSPLFFHNCIRITEVDLGQLREKGGDILSIS